MMQSLFPNMYGVTCKGSIKEKRSNEHSVRDAGAEGGALGGGRVGRAGDLIKTVVGGFFALLCCIKFVM